MSAQRHRRGDRGFTLVELLVVIAILGVLAGVVVFSVSGVTGAYPASAAALVPGYLGSGPTLVTYATPSTYTWTSATCSGIAGIGTP